MYSLLIFVVVALLVAGLVHAAKTPQAPIRGYVRCPACGALAAVVHNAVAGKPEA